MPTKNLKIIKLTARHTFAQLTCLNVPHDPTRKYQHSKPIGNDIHFEFLLFSPLEQNHAQSHEGFPPVRLWKQRRLAPLLWFQLISICCSLETCSASSGECHTGSGSLENGAFYRNLELPVAEVSVAIYVAV